MIVSSRAILGPRSLKELNDVMRHYTFLEISQVTHPHISMVHILFIVVQLFDWLYDLCFGHWLWNDL
jgi:hypothetical protein